MTSVWRRKKRNKDAFKVARRGDDLMVQFECDWCVFKKLRGKIPDHTLQQDIMLMACIRRANLDAFWSRAGSTVNSQAALVKKGIGLSAVVGIEPPYLEPGPLPSHDHCGYGVAIQLLLKSREAGKYHSSHQQWDTVRRMSVAYRNQVRASGVANSSTLSVGEADGKKYSRICEDPCASLWYSRFSAGCKRRMGQDWRPDRAITPELMKSLMSKIEERLESKTLDESYRRRLVMAGAYFAITYVDSLRGPEGLLVDLGGLRRNFVKGEDLNYVIVALLGQVKGEHGEREHLLPTASKTRSGINVRGWVRRVIVVNQQSGRETGPAFCDDNGVVLKSRDMNEVLHDLLGEIFVEHPALFQSDIQSFSDIEDKYSVYRSFRRGSDSLAIAMKVPSEDIKVVNRWSKKEASGTSKPSMDMTQYYAEIHILLPSFMRYTGAM
jgi:hypothetical protein